MTMQSKYQQEQMERAKHLHKLLTDIAFHLNVGEKTPVWAYSKPADPEQATYPSQAIKHASKPGAEIDIRIESYGASKGRIQVSGNFHVGKNKAFVDVREYSNGMYSSLPHISCAPTKTAEQIAKDIKTRFLPEYLQLLDKAIAKRDAAENYRLKTRANLLELARIINVDAEEKLRQYEKNRGENVSELSCYASDRGYATIRANDTGVSTLVIDNITMDQARRILRIVAEPRGKEATSESHDTGDHCPSCFNAGYDARDKRSA